MSNFDPQFLRRIGVKQLSNGVLLMPRKNKNAERFMDENFIRVTPIERIWHPKLENALPWSDPTFAEVLGNPEKIYIVGKGQSIDTLTPEDFQEDWPIFCVNEAIQIIDAMADDLPNIRVFVHIDNQVIVKEMRPDTVCLASARMLKRLANYEHLFYCEDFDLTLGTASFCIEAAKTLGCSEVILDGLDFLQHGNRRYASTIERTQLSSVPNLARITNNVRIALNGIKYSFNRP